MPHATDVSIGEHTLEVTVTTSEGTVVFTVANSQKTEREEYARKITAALRILDRGELA